MSLEESWRAFSGIKSAISFNTGSQHTDLSLEQRLSCWRLACEKYSESNWLSGAFTPQMENREPSSQWLLSRTCLLDVLEKLTEDGASLEAISVSLAHTHGASVAIGAVGSGFRVGVDLEKASRSITEKAAARFSTPTENLLGYSPLETWVIKEACFKANPNNSDTIIPDYEISNREWVTVRNHPDVRLRFKVFQHEFEMESWLLAFAILMPGLNRKYPAASIGSA